VGIPGLHFERPTYHSEPAKLGEIEDVTWVTLSGPIFVAWGLYVTKGGMGGLDCGTA